MYQRICDFFYWYRRLGPKYGWFWSIEWSIHNSRCYTRDGEYRGRYGFKSWIKTNWSRDSRILFLIDLYRVEVCPECFHLGLVSCMVECVLFWCICLYKEICKLRYLHSDVYQCSQYTKINQHIDVVWVGCHLFLHSVAEHCTKTKDFEYHETEQEE